MTRFGFRLRPRLLEALRVADAGSLVGAEFPVTWGDHEARGKVVGVEPDDEGIVVTVEFLEPSPGGFPAFLAY